MAMSPWFPEKPCVIQNMKDEGVVTKKDLSVTPIEHDDGSTTLMVKGLSPSGQTPVFISATLTPSASLTSVTVTPHGADGHPVGATKEAKPTSPTTPTTVKFDAPTEADHIIVVLHSSSPDKTTHADLASVVACMPDTGSCDCVLLCLVT
jgi:hypothetical protein